MTSARAPWLAVSRARRRVSGRRFGLPRSKPIIRARSTKACGFNGAQILGGERIGVPSPRQRHGWRVGNSLLRRPSAWNSDWEAQEASGAHRDAYGGERSVREGLEGAVRRRRWLMLRGNMANVTGASASWIEARVREIASGGELLDVSRGKGEKGGARFGLYG